MEKIEDLTQVVREAGKMALEGWPRLGPIKREEGGEVIIELEAKIDQFYEDQLTKLFPGYTLSSSHHNPDNQPSSKLVLYDGIDGAINYAAKVPFFCSAVALIDNGQIQAAVVFDPVHNDLFSATKGGGATLNGSPIQVSEIKNLKQALVSIESIEHHPTSLRNLFSPLHNQSWATTMPHSTILSSCYVAAGRFDAHIFNGRRQWDIAPATLMVIEAKGQASDLGGKPWSLPIKEHGIVVAATVDLQVEILALIKG